MLKLNSAISFGLVISALWLSSCKMDSVQQHPNVILIMTDDQGWGDLSIHGNDSLQTPAIDALSKESAILDRFYVSPVCAPTRASLLTGRYHLRTGTTWVTHRKEVMRSQEVTIAEMFKKNGYRTGMFGKWHNGEQYPNDPRGQGFDEFTGFSAGHWNNYFDTKVIENGEYVTANGYIIDYLTDKAIDFINAESGQPFFCYIPYNTPHSPLQIADHYYEKYKAMGLTDYNAAVYGMVENIDDNVDRILKALDAGELADNTIVIFTTDNGPNGWRYNGGMKGKKASYDEGGVRVPFFIRYPNGNLIKNTPITDLTAHIDILPTLADLCRIPVPDNLALDGRSFAPLLRGEVASLPERTLFTFPTSQRLQPHPGAVRTNQYRLVLEHDGSLSLYDMPADPGQELNIAADQPAVVSELHAAYLSAFEDVTKSGNIPPPIPIGYDESKRVHLPAPEAQLFGNIKFKEGWGWANDWITNWTSEEDYAEWDVEFVQSGKYEITIQYTCPPEDVGASVALQLISPGGIDRASRNITEAFDPPYLPSPDRVKRWEVYEKEWKEMVIARIELPKGRRKIRISAPEIPGKQAFELKALWVKKLDVEGG